MPTSVVVLFDRPRRLAAELTPSELQRQARLKARAQGATVDEAQAVGGEAAALHQAGEPNHVVLERCESLARELVAQREALRV